MTFIDIGFPYYFLLSSLTIRLMMKLVYRSASIVAALAAISDVRAGNTGIGTLGLAWSSGALMVRAHFLPRCHAGSKPATSIRTEPHPF